MARKMEAVEYPFSRSPLLNTMSQIGDYQEIDWEASKDLLEKEHVVWPFETVTRVEAMQAIEQLIQMRNDAQFGMVDGKKKPAAAIADNITAKSYATLKVVQALERESKQMVLDSFKKGIPFEARYKEMQSFVSLFDSTLAKQNNDACLYVEEQLSEQNIKIPYIDLEESQYTYVHKRSYMDSAEIGFAKDATNAHYEAAKVLYEDILEIIDSGIYGDELKTKIAAKFNCTNNDAYSEKVKDLVSAEAKLEIVNKWILPELENQLFEDALNAHREELRNLELPEHKRDFYFRDEYNYTAEQIKTIKEIVDDLRVKETELCKGKNCSLGITYDAKSNVIDVALKYDSEGIKDPEKKQESSKAIEGHFENTKEKDHKQQNLFLKIGVASSALYEQVKETYFKKWGFKNDMGFTIFKRGLKNELSIDAGTYENKSTIKTRMSDRAGFQVSGKASLLKVNDTVFFVAKDKDIKLLGLGSGIGSASLDLNATKLIPTFKMSALIAEVEGTALNDKLKAKGSFGTIGVNTDIKTNLMSFVQSLNKDIGKTARDEQDKSFFDSVKDSAKGVLDKLKNPTPSFNPSAKISVMDYSVLEGKFNGSEIETYNAIKNLMSHPHVQKFANDLVVPITTMLPVTKQATDHVNSVMKLACAKFAVNGDLVPSQIKPDAIVFVEREGLPIICRISDLEKGDKIVLPSYSIEQPELQNDVVAEIQDIVQTEEGISIVTNDLVASTEDFSQEYKREVEGLFKQEQQQDKDHANDIEMEEQDHGPILE